jgi:hypothetical protein
MSTIADMKIKIGADSSGLQKGLKDAKTAINDTFDTSPINAMTEAINGTTTSMGGFVQMASKYAALLAGGFGLVSLIDGAAKAGAATENLTRKLGMTVEEVGLLKKTLQLTGGDIETASKTVMKLDKSFTTAGEAGDKVRATLAAVGVSLTDQDGKLLPINEQLKRLADGYKEATAAGYGQEFIMNTLGAKGLTLVDTLNRYSEAQERAAKVQGIGLNVEELDKLNMDIQVLQMQAQQVGLAFGQAFLPIAQDVLPSMMDALKTVSAFLKENKDHLASFITLATKGVLVWKSMGIAAAAYGTVASTVAALRVQEEIAAETTLTRFQQKAIAQRVKAIEAEALKAIKAYEKELASKKLTEDEKTLLVQQETVKRIAQAEKEAAAVKAALTEEMLAYNGVAVAETRVGEAAKVASVAQVSGAGKATGAVRILSGAVTALKNNWLLVALAIYEAVEALKAYNLAKFQNDHGTEVTYKGEKYVVKGDDISKISLQRPDTASMGDYDDAGFWGFGNYGLGDNVEISKIPLTKGSALYESVMLHYNTDDPERKAAYIAKNEAEARARNSEIPGIDLSSLGNVGGDGSSVGSGGKIKQPTLSEVEVSIGNKVYEEAFEHIGEEWGSNTCAAFVTAMLKEAGANAGIGGDLVKTLVDNAGYAAHPGELPSEKGDLVYWVRDDGDGNPYQHIGIYDGRGGHIASNTHGVTHADSLSGDWYGNGYRYGGYISMRELTGDQTYKASMDNDAKKLADAQRKLEQAQQEATRLSRDLQTSIMSESGTEYESNMAKHQANLMEKAYRISKLRTAGVDEEQVKKLQDQLAEYAKSLDANVEKKWNQAYTSMVDTAKQAHAAVLHDYEAQAQAEYEATIHNLDREREEKEKSLMRDKDDIETKEKISEWYYSRVQLAEENLRKAKKQAHEEYINYLKEEGDILAIIADAKNNGGAYEDESRVKGMKALSEQYAQYAANIHMSFAEQIATVSGDAYNALSENIEGFIMRTKSASDAFSGFINSVLNSVAKIAAQRLASRWIGSLLGGMVTGGAGGGWADAIFNAEGGYISGPGTDTSDSIPSYLSNGEFVVNARATRKYRGLLEKINSYASGGLVTAPSMASPSYGGGYSSASDMGGSSSGGGGCVVNITNKTNDEVSVTDSHFDEEMGRWVLDVVVDGAARNRGGFGTNLKTALGY